jgi:hypothetical protein
MKKIKLFPAFILCSMFLASCTNSALPVATDPLYEIVPHIANCMEGSLSSIERHKVLAYINSLRTTHNLPLVKYDSLKDNLAQKAALIGAANGTVSEAITASSECYNPEAALACSNGNRSLWSSETMKWPLSEIHINEWIMESSKDNVSCRRRLLDPFLKSVTFGRVIGTPKKGDSKYVSSATLLSGYGNVDLSEYEISYIACPHGNYNAKLFDPDSFLSFSVLHDKYSKENNSFPLVDFSEATVEVSVGTQILNIVVDSHDYNNIGLPNNLQWKVEGLTKNVSYSVKIRDVIVAGERKNYDYTFSFK